MNKVYHVFKLIFGPMNLRKNPYLFLIQFIILVLLMVTIIPALARIVVYLGYIVGAYMDSILKSLGIL